VNAPSPRTVASQRWDAIDVARGVAIVAMVVYHSAWDLSFLRLVPGTIIGDPAWNWFARGIAGSFLMLAGVGLALGHAAGFNRAGFLRRLLTVGGAALVITVVTAVAFPESFIFFGILHAIAVGSVLALPFLRLPALATLVAAALCLAAPRLFTSPALDRPLLDWLGLGTDVPVTYDYVPVFPWFGMMLIGIAAGRWLVRRSEPLSLARWRSRDWFTGALAWMGRKSLPIYLIHQPVILGIVYSILMLTGPNQTAAARPFLAQCTAQCTQANGDAAFCRRACGCVVETLRADGIWPRIEANTPTADDQSRISDAAQTCLRRDPP
jgi:uncharacterized membrane protein